MVFGSANLLSNSATGLSAWRARYSSYLRRSLKLVKHVRFASRSAMISPSCEPARWFDGRRARLGGTCRASRRSPREARHLPPAGSSADLHLLYQVGDLFRGEPSRAADGSVVFSSPRSVPRAAAMVPTAESPKRRRGSPGGAGSTVVAATVTSPTHGDDAALHPADVAPVSQVSRSTSGVDSSADEARVGIASGEVSYYDTTAGVWCDDRIRCAAIGRRPRNVDEGTPARRGVSRSVRGPGAVRTLADTTDALSRERLCLLVTGCLEETFHRLSRTEGNCSRPTRCDDGRDRLEILFHSRANIAIVCSLELR